MTIPSWNESYATGEKQIDDQHRDLLGLVDELEISDRELASLSTMRALLDRVLDFNVVHFIMEENLMVRVEYPLIDQIEMRTQHNEFTSFMRLRVIEFQHSPSEDIMPLREFLTDWLITHEFGLDRKLAQFIQSQIATT